jgi:hypothetical protein
VDERVELSCQWNELAHFCRLISHSMYR